ncbi:response regulator [Lysinibacillus sphaericus]|uniref:Response regulatory domain-containing protein n=1 Tax=Lysinibacillus sphaericus OT4b.31 TaxID=1285586 RepID=R7Z847_LYSSH|nr:response regulator [Lysinibacillus sphaericus]EON70288.1 hypothetical protein H131_22219 [Lysinibacillus sphaericus OT4b.31]
MIRIILIGQEQVTIDTLTRELHEFHSIMEVVSVFSSVKELCQEKDKDRFEVAFLDVDNCDMEWLDIIEKMKKLDSNVHLVVLTAYKDYAVEAFEINAFDFILKPISQLRLAETIDRLKERLYLGNRTIPNASPCSPSLKIQCFGGFTVYHKNNIVNWRTSHTKELFAFLLTNLNTEIHRDTILESIWGDIETKKARIRLHTTITYLRTALSHIGYKNKLRYKNNHYILSMEDLQCDAFELEKLTQNIANLDIERAETFLKSYSGDFLQSMYYSWVADTAKYYHDQFTLLLEKMIEVYTLHGDLKKKEETLLIWLQQDYYSDQIIQKLLQHYIETGNRADAIQVFNRFQENLKNDLGIFPTSKTIAIYEKIIND